MKYFLITISLLISNLAYAGIQGFGARPIPYYGDELPEHINGIEDAITVGHRAAGDRKYMAKIKQRIVELNKTSNLTGKNPTQDEIAKVGEIQAELKWWRIAYQQAKVLNKATVGAVQVASSAPVTEEPDPLEGM